MVKATMPQYPRVVFHPSHDARSKEEMTDRGYVSHVYVVTKGERYFPVFFYDPLRLGQDLNQEIKLGRPFIAEPGMIVVPEVTLEAMTKAVEALYADGYFDHLVSVQTEPGSV